MPVIKVTELAERNITKVDDPPDQDPPENRPIDHDKIRAQQEELGTRPYTEADMKFVVVAEGDVEDVISRRGSIESVRAFMEGVERGAGYYGSGGCACYLKGDDLSELDDGTRKAVEKALGVNRG